MKRTLIALVAALGLASSASAATLTLDTDAATYSVSDTITVTLVLNVAQNDLAASVFTEITWDGSIATSAANSTQDNILQAFGGFIIAIPGTGTCLNVNGQCVMHDQILGLSPVPVDANIVTATLLMNADSLGLLNLGLGAINAFGLTPDRKSVV